MGILVLAAAVPAIVMVVCISPTPKTESAVVYRMVVHAGIIAMLEVYAVVCTNIGMIAGGSIEVEIVTIVVALIDAQPPRVTYHIDGTVEVVAVDESTVLAVAQHVHQIFVAHIKQVVIVVDGIIVAVYDIVDNLAHLIQEVEIDFIHIIILAVIESELVAHAVGKEAGIATDVMQVYRRKTLCADSCQGYRHNGKSHRFHDCRFFRWLVILSPLSAAKVQGFFHPSQCFSLNIKRKIPPCRGVFPFLLYSRGSKRKTLSPLIRELLDALFILELADEELVIVLSHDIPVEPDDDHLLLLCSMHHTSAALVEGDILTNSHVTCKVLIHLHMQ